ncbi:acyl carrier protein [Solihabitans fulvus]|nr:acyl carrier protein [Solihabitans fulvus]
MSTTGPDLLDKSSGVDRLFAVIKEVLGVVVQPDTHFLDLGGDSMDAVIIADMIVEEFGVGPELDSFFVSNTVRDLADSWWVALAAPAS